EPHGTCAPVEHGETCVSKVGAISQGPACEEDHLIVEVIGKDHPDGQRIVIYDQSDNEQQEWLTRRVKKEPLIDSTLQTWPWRNQPKRNLWLEIEAEKGNPIRVPLIRDATATPRQMERQRNVIVPVVPMTTLRGVS